MVSALQSHHDVLAQLCRRFAVARLDAFGSITRADVDPAWSARLRHLIDQARVPAYGTAA
jgi:hypothetical protein